jgi:hypothetical protein
MPSMSDNRVAVLEVDQCFAYIVVDDASKFPVGHPARSRTRRRSYRVTDAGTLLFEPSRGWPELEVTGDRSIALAFLFGLKREGLTQRMAGLRGEDL